MEHSKLDSVHSMLSIISQWLTNSFCSMPVSTNARDWWAESPVTNKNTSHLMTFTFIKLQCEPVTYIEAICIHTSVYDHKKWYIQPAHPSKYTPDHHHLSTSLPVHPLNPPSTPFDPFPHQYYEVDQSPSSPEELDDCAGDGADLARLAVGRRVGASPSYSEELDDASAGVAWRVVDCWPKRRRSFMSMMIANFDESGKMACAGWKSLR